MLLACENQTLLVRRNTFLVHNLGFHVVWGVERLDVERDDFTRHQQVPNDTHSYGAAMVLAKGTSFEHRSDSPTLTVWRLEVSERT